MSKSNGSRWLDRGLFVSPIYYVLCTTENQFHAELKRLKIPTKYWPEYVNSGHADATVHQLENGNKKRCAIVCLVLNTKRTPAEVYGLLVHEAVHIWREVKESIGEKYPCAEFEAYCIQAIAQRLIELYLKDAAKLNNKEKKGKNK